jgi:hypothetical protein
MTAMTGFEQCAFDVAQHALEIVKKTVGFQNPDQLTAVHDMIILVCEQTKGLVPDVNVDDVIRGAIIDMYTPQS